MKKLFSLFLSALMISFLVSSQSMAQFHMSLGPEMGMNFNIHTGSDLEESGSGMGFVVGGQLDMDFSRVIGLVTTMQFYDNRSGSTTKESSETYRDQQGNPVNATISDESTLSLAYFMIEPLLKLKIPSSDFYFVVGPSVGFNVEGSSEREVSTKFPPPYQNNDKTEKNKASLKDLLARFELKFGSGYNIPVSNSIVLFPQVTFGYGITKVQSDISWRILTIQALFGVKFKLM